MIDFMSSWAEQIVLAVVIATIIELILPKNKNKKYIQMVLGVYVLFNIISPVIKDKENFSIEQYNLENYEVESQYKINQSSMDERIERIYLEELENNIIDKFEKNNYKVVKCNIDAVLDTTKKNAGIHSIKVKIEGENDESKISEIKKEIVEELEIEDKKVSVLFLYKGKKGTGTKFP